MASIMSTIFGTNNESTNNESVISTVRDMAKNTASKVASFFSFRLLGKAQKDATLTPMRVMKNYYASLEDLGLHYVLKEYFGVNNQNDFVTVYYPRVQDRIDRNPRLNRVTNHQIWLEVWADLKTLSDISKVDPKIAEAFAAVAKANEPKREKKNEQTNESK